MAFTIVTNDPLAARITGVARREMQEAQAGADESMKIGLDEKGIVFEFGRGVSDTNVTFIALKNTNEDTVYIYPNAAGKGVVVTTTKP